MPRICAQCGEEHLTQEELEEDARKITEGNASKKRKITKIVGSKEE